MQCSPSPVPARKIAVIKAPDAVVGGNGDEHEQNDQQESVHVVGEEKKQGK